MEWREMYCPRCDRVYKAKTKNSVLEIVKKHVAEQHPDHDPEWWDTHPHNDHEPDISKATIKTVQPRLASR